MSKSTCGAGQGRGVRGQLSSCCRTGSSCHGRRLTYPHRNTQTQQEGQRGAPRRRTAATLLAFCFGVRECGKGRGGRPGQDQQPVLLLWTRQGADRPQIQGFPGELELGWRGWRDGVQDVMRARLEHRVGQTNSMSRNQIRIHSLLSRPCPTATMSIGNLAVRLNPRPPPSCPAAIALPLCVRLRAPSRRLADPRLRVSSGQPCKSPRLLRGSQRSWNQSRGPRRQSMAGGARPAAAAR